jgi:hypothetical protein
MGALSRERVFRAAGGAAPAQALAVPLEQLMSLQQETRVGSEGVCQGAGRGIGS